MRKDKAFKFMQVARSYAEIFSKDPSTKVGAVLADSVDFTQLTQGYNGMPRGIDESIPERQQRPLKYAFYEHAERNALYNLARPLLKGSIAVSSTALSLSCARALMSVGVSAVVVPQPEAQDAEMALASALFKETGIEVHVFSEEGLIQAQGQDARHVRKLEAFIRHTRQLPALLGKDPHGSATVFIDAQDYTQLTQGYSGLPRGADDSRTERYLGEMRHMWVESSVRNAIYNCLRSKLKGSVAFVTATTCVECARALASVGVSKVFYQEPTEDFVSRWKDSIDEALRVLDELGVAHESMPRG